MELPNPRRYFSRTMLVMQALSVVSAVFLIAGLDNGFTYKEPMQNMVMRLILFPKPMLSAEMQGIGKARMTRSSMIAKAAPI